MGFWVTLLIQIGLMLAYELLRPKPTFDDPEPAGVSDFKFPTIGEGRAMPIVWGTVKLAGPMVTWFGDLRAIAQKEKRKTGIFSSEEVVTHYHYWLGMQLALCSGEIDEVTGIYFDQRLLDLASHTYGSGGTTYVIEDEWTKILCHALSLFGGEEEEGGVYGWCYVYRGSHTQPSDIYLEAKIGEDLPAWRGICYVVFRQFYMGNSPYIKDVAYRVRRCPNALGLTDGAENIDGDANPAAMIYDLLTSAPSDNGLGIPVGDIDIDTFRTVGATLANEELGLSMTQDRSTPAKELVFDICRHIDAVCYEEPSTGLYTMRLIRNDYDPETLLVLDESNCTVTGFARASWGETKNQVRVSYVDRADDFTERTVQAQELAAIEVAGGAISTQDFTLRGFSNAVNAQNACARALMGVSFPLAVMNIKADRTGWSLRPGSPFKLVWPELGIDNLICRVTRIGMGTLTSGEIELEAAEDVFGIEWAAYTAPGGSDWVDPAGDVQELTAQDIMRAPYEAVKLLPAPEGVRQAVTMAARSASGVTKGYNAIVDSSPTRVALMTPTGTLQSAITEVTTSFVVDMGPDSEFLESLNEPDFNAGLNVLWLETAGGVQEFMAFQTVSINEETQEITVSGLARGCLDTAPTAFPGSARVWFLSSGNGIVNIADSGVTTVTFQPFNNHGTLDLGDCDDSTVAPITPGRRSRVYCPTDAKFNGASYPTSISGELTVSWEHRDRLGEWGYADSGMTTTPEEDTEYDVLVYGESDTLIHTEQGITGKSWTYLEADEIADSAPLGRLNNHLRVIIRTYGDNRSHQAIREIEWEFDRV
jgi:hypothetical protein